MLLYLLIGSILVFLFWLLEYFLIKWNMDIDPYVYQDKSIWMLNWKNTILGILFWPLFIIMIISGWFYLLFYK